MRRTLANHDLSHTLVLSAQHSLYYVRDASRSTLKPLTAVNKLHSLRNNHPLRNTYISHRASVK